MNAEFPDQALLACLIRAGLNLQTTNHSGYEMGVVPAIDSTSILSSGVRIRVLAERDSHLFLVGVCEIRVQRSPEMKGTSVA